MNVPRPKFLEPIFERWETLSYGEQRTFTGLAVLALVLAVAPLLYLALRPSVNHWRHRQALQQADRFEQQGDDRNLVLALHRATLIAPSDVPTWSRVARTLDRLGASDALVAHANVLALAPGDANARAALAAAALRFGSPATARRTLTELEHDPAQRETYLRLVAELARRDGNRARYEAALVALLAFFPADPEIRLSHALLHASSHSLPRQDEARPALLALLTPPSTRVRAALGLLRLAADRRSPEFAGQVGRELVARLSPSAPAPRDERELWPVLVAGLQEAAASTPDDVARVAQWLGTVRRGSEAVAWFNRLPVALQSVPTTRDTLTELYARTDSLPELRQFLTDGAWGSMSADCARLAVEARAATLAGHDSVAITRWQDAVREAESSAPALRALGRLARLWRNDRGFEAVAKTAIRTLQQAEWPFVDLCELYLSRGETAKLLTVATNWAEREPDSSRAVWTWIRVGAALNQFSLKMESRASEVYANDSSSPAAILAIASVAAFQGRIEAAQEILKTLPANDKLPVDALLCRALISRDREARQLLFRLPPQSLLPEEIERLKLP